MQGRERNGDERVDEGWAEGGQRVDRGAPSGPEISRVGAKMALFAPRGPRDGPLGALFRPGLPQCGETPVRGRA